jgi:putative ABC transport system ATP-binding protein
MIKIDHLRFRYPRSDFELAIESLQIERGEKVAIVGPSGSGKTTLLNLLAGISVPDSGRIQIFEDDVGSLTDARRRDFRISNIGMVFQQFELVEYLPAKDNILVPFFINSTLELSRDVRNRAEDLADSMGLRDKLQRRPGKLSQGEQQRVAICRALITEPQLILADEPTGNLDPANKTLILDILFDQVAKNGQTLVVVTHDMSLLQGFDRTIDFAQFRVDVGLPLASETVT